MLGVTLYEDALSKKSPVFLDANVLHLEIEFIRKYIKGFPATELNSKLGRTTAIVGKFFQL